MNISFWRPILYALVSGFVIGLMPSCIKFRGDLDETRIVTINRSAPQGNGRTGLHSRFGILIRDSLDDPQSLRTYAKVDSEESVRCKLDPSPTNTIDETRDEDIFWCPVDGRKLASGEHKIRFWILTRNDEVEVERNIIFYHDAEAPSLTASLESTGVAKKIVWSVAEGDDFKEIEVWANGTRVFSSFSPEGEASVDNVLLGNFPVEIRAYDQVVNVSTIVLSK